MMDARTLEALQASIAKWERNAEAKTPEDVKMGPAECPLCMTFNSLFVLKTGHTECFGCPVFEKTGLHGCNGTPYDIALTDYLEWSDGDEDAASKFASKAASEVAFLKSLLPSEDAGRAL